MSEGVIIAILGGVFSLLAIILQHHLTSKRHSRDASAQPSTENTPKEKQTVIEKIIVQHPQPKISYGLRSSVLLCLAFVMLVFLGMYEEDIDTMSDEEAVVWFFIWGGMVIFGFYYMGLGLLWKFRNRKKIT